MFRSVWPRILVFMIAQANSAKDVLAAVKTTITEHPSAPVTIVGHSLGGAIATLDALYLYLELPSAVFRVVTFGLPRVGNLAWASYLSSIYNVETSYIPSTPSSLTPFSLVHINNKEDPIPTLPPTLLLDYRQPTGEIHIEDSGTWEVCPGMDNSSPLCSAGDVSSLLKWNLTEHGGPYSGVTMGCAGAVGSFR